MKLHELIDADLPARELKRLTRVDAVLRAAAHRDCERTRLAISAALDHELSEPESFHIGDHVEHRDRCRAFQANAAMSATALRTAANRKTHELKLTFGELALIYKSLRAAKALAALPPDDELLNDTIQLVDQTLNKAL